MYTNYGKEDTIMRSQNTLVTNAQEHTALHWPKGVVTYYLDNLTYDYHIAQRARMAMNVLEAVSCVMFKPTLIKPAGNMTWIHFTNPQGERNCVHKPTYKTSGEIVLILGFDCLKEHEILHTLLHAIGFKDEVSHPQRDQYIRVMWNNIQPEYRNLYRVQSSAQETSRLLVEYDPLSIMHFHDRAFSINGRATVMPLVPGLLISPSDDLSQLDKMRLRLLFDHECNKRKVGDMIDTCKMLLSNNAKPNVSKNKTESKSQEKQRDIDKVDKVEDTHEHEEGNEVIKVTGATERNEIETVTEGTERNEIDAVEDQNNTKLKSAENQYDLNETYPDTVLNRQIPIKLLESMGKKKETEESISVQDFENK